MKFSKGPSRGASSNFFEYTNAYILFDRVYKTQYTYEDYIILL
jgi:hypothetical protein